MQGLHSPCTVLGCIRWRSLTKCSNNSRVRVVKCSESSRRWNLSSFDLKNPDCQSQYKIRFYITVCVCTWHVYHPAITVLQQIPGFTVDATRCYAVGGEVLRVHGSRSAVAPGRWKILKLRYTTQCYSLMLWTCCSITNQSWAAKPKKRHLVKGSITEYQLKNEIKISGAQCSHFSSERVFERNELQRNATGI